MNWLSILMAGCTIYAVGLAAGAPASLLALALPDGWRLEQTQGTLWSGAGRVSLQDRTGRLKVAQGLHWAWQPAELLRGRMAFEVNPERSPASFPVYISFSRIEIAHADIELPASTLGLAVPRLASLGLNGDLQLHVDRAVLHHEVVSGNAILRWGNAGSALTTVAPLGEYELRVSADDNAIRAAISTLKGPLQLSGQGSWALGAPPNLPVSAFVPVEQREKLSPILNLIGVERDPGRFELQINPLN